MQSLPCAVRALQQRGDPELKEQESRSPYTVGRVLWKPARSMNVHHKQRIPETPYTNVRRDGKLFCKLLQASRLCAKDMVPAPRYIAVWMARKMSLVRLSRRDHLDTQEDLQNNYAGLF